MGFWHVMMAMVDPHVSIHIQETHRSSSLCHSVLGKSAAELRTSPKGSQARQLPPEGLHLGSTIEAQNTTEVLRRMLLQALRSFDA
jgi:hypothetical protein